ncbi:MAG: histidine kinase dimerization/phospho-acceptor domain-containing protein, partial [Bacteroidota bacterium]
MQLNRIRTVIIASAVALVALTVFQVTWMQHSRNLIREGFEQKLKMALCSAMDAFGESCKNNDACSTHLTAGFPIAAKFDASLLNDPDLHEALRNSLNNYGIPLAYELQLVDAKSECNLAADPYCCKVNITKAQTDEPQLLRIAFPGKAQYIRGQMGLMLGTSVILIALIAMAFLWSIYNLLRLRKINQINKDFFNNMAHEFKTPLTNIGLASSMLQKREPQLQHNRFLEIVDHESKRLKTQVERVLHLARMENGHYQLQKERIDPAQLLRQLVEEMQMQIKNHKATVQLRLPDQPLEIEADPFHLSNAFRNLIENALLYARQQPKIVISL